MGKRSPGDELASNLQDSRVRKGTSGAATANQTLDNKSSTLTEENLRGNILGLGRPTFCDAFRTPAGASLMGGTTVNDDAVTAADGLDGVAYHEILHTLGYGLGSVWDDLLARTPDGQLRFTGENATDVYLNDLKTFSADDPFANVGVPVDNDGVRLDVDVLTANVIESGFIAPGTDSGDNLIALAAASFEDLGYDTHFDDGLPVLLTYDGWLLI